MFDFLKSYKNKRVFITGDTGFKGAWLSFWLSRLGANVVGYALPPESHQTLFKQLELDEKTHHIDGDIRDYCHLEKAIAAFSPEYIFHLAAQPLVRLSYENPVYTFDVNVMGTVNLLEIARGLPHLRSFINVTSDKCYKNREWVWGYRENDELGGHDPYSASKAAAEVVFSSYVSSYFALQDSVGVASARAGNVIGGGDWSQDRILPDAIRALQKNEKIMIRNPSAVRPWQHVLEPLFGYLLLAEKLAENPRKYMGSWNFGPEIQSVKTVEVLVQKIIHSWEGGGEYFCQNSKITQHEANLLMLNCDKAAQLLDWRPQWSFDACVEKTISWYQSELKGDQMIEITQKQIESYMEQLL